ncbi:MAG: hypothetical protein WAT51_15745 [Holophaga sp.]
MPAEVLSSRSSVTGIAYCWSVPGGLPAEGPAPAAVFFLNGIGLDQDGFREVLQAPELERPRYLYRNCLHVALTVPGFEDAPDRAPEAPLGMVEQGRRVAAFLGEFLAQHPALDVILYGFSFGSDLAVEVLPWLGSEVPLSRVILTEMNVNAHSCFITSRLAASYAAAKREGPGRNQEAHKGFVSLVVKANTEGRISDSLMQDMAVYFRTIAKKDWAQLARSAQEASQDPEARVAQFLGLTAEHPRTQFDLVFSDPEDLRIFHRRVETWGGKLGQVRILDATAHEHFHHMSRAGVLENLGGRQSPGGGLPGLFP